MRERRVQAEVIGPGVPGQVKIALGSNATKRVITVPADQIPSHLRMPNSMCVVVLSGHALVRVEDFDQQLIELQEKIRTILNTKWDPIGTAGAVDDEYDSYIGDIVHLLERGASTDEMAEHLTSIEVDRMALTGSPRHKLLAIADSLRALNCGRRKS